MPLLTGAFNLGFTWLRFRVWVLGQGYYRERIPISLVASLTVTLHHVSKPQLGCPMRRQRDHTKSLKHISTYIFSLGPSVIAGVQDQGTFRLSATGHQAVERSSLGQMPAAVYKANIILSPANTNPPHPPNKKAIFSNT